MKLKHNKKRNTAFLFEVLAKELTKAVVSKDSKRKGVVLRVIKESFNDGSTLKRELSIYNSLLGPNKISARQATRVYSEAVSQYTQLDKEAIFKEQTALINKINKLISAEVFDNFVPSYTAMATAYQLFNNDLDPKSKVILEEQVLADMTRSSIFEASQRGKVVSDKLVMMTHIKKFNNTFGGNLLSEQKALLQKYINSFSDNGLGLKVFLNEEIFRIRAAIEDENQDGKMAPVLETIDSFKNQWITGDLLKKVLKLQELVGELQKNVG
jgi:hypothetical protein